MLERSRRRSLNALLLSMSLSAALCVAVRPVSAQTAAAPFPSKPITIVVPYTPGSGADILARSVSPEMGRLLKQPVVVDNRAGASGTIGTAVVTRSAPDGYTLLMSADTLTVTPSLYKNLTFSPARDLVPVGRAAIGVFALVVNPAVPAQSLQEFVAYAKTNPGKLAYGTPGIGTPQHVLMELFKQSASIDMLHAPYKGMSGALTDLMGGQIQAGIMSMNVAMAQVGAGKLRLLAVVDTKRSTAAPAVPTFTEAGYPQLSQPTWFGMFAPAGTPPQIIGRLYEAMTTALDRKDVQDSLVAQGLQLSVAPSDELKAVMLKDLDRWKSVIEKAGIVAE